MTKLPGEDLRAGRRAAAASAGDRPPGQIVLVMQGGGALGAFQAGVYQALHEAGIEPDWVVGTSIGAINGALIAGNAPAERLARLRCFWDLMAASGAPWGELGTDGAFLNLMTLSFGIPGFFSPNPLAWVAPHLPLGIAEAGYYNTEPLRETLAELVDFGRLASGETRLTLGAVNVLKGHMRYFDTRHEAVGLDHVMASGALPPAFPAVIIDGEPYWDGGIYSNTPLEVVMDDNPRRDSVIFAAHLWQHHGDAPRSISDALLRQKDIRYSSRTDSHTARHQQIHRLRHVVQELGRLLPDDIRESPEARELLSWGCTTVMHVLQLNAPALSGEDESKDIDFTPQGIGARWQAGYQLTRQRIAEAPWKKALERIAGVVVHE